MSNVNSDKAQLKEGAMGFTSWQAGQTINMPMLLVGACCCMAIPLCIHIHNAYAELKRFFPEYDDSQSWLKSLITIWGLLTIDKEIDTLAEKYGLEIPKPKMPPVVGLVGCCCIGWFVYPFIVSDKLNRITELCKAYIAK